MVSSVLLLAAAFVVFAFTHDVAVAVVAMTITGAASGLVRPVTMRRLSQISKDHPELPGLGQVAGLMERAFGVANAAVIVLGGILITSFSFRTGMLLLAAILVLSEGAVLALARGSTASTG
jgi:predicted MFS family arabinose efflux permease